MNEVEEEYKHLSSAHSKKRSFVLKDAITKQADSSLFSSAKHLGAYSNTTQY